ncbi:hypothetical protein [Sporosarcina sp. SAFN-010]|uniref:hypothetical protein n=1 Tax=Sporosarcina sp. SAFN-010 TaxID=3387273 RepID=UPI003F7E001F
MTTKTTNPTIDYSTMPRLKAFHPVRYGEGFPQRKIEGREQYANVTDMQLKRAPRTTLEGSARDMITMIERAKQELIRANPPVNCKGYVERSDYPITSLYSDYKDKIEDGSATWSDYHAERKKWRQCRHMFCLNMYPIDRNNFRKKPAKRKDARFCCDDCRVAQKDADNRYSETGSYLPVYFYLPRLTETVNDEARLYESAYEGEDIEKEIDKKRPERVQKLKRSNGGGGTRGGVIKKYKSLAEAEKGYAEQDRTGWRKIN